MSDHTDWSAEDEARRCEADRLEGLIAKYQTVLATVSGQCERMATQLGELESDTSNEHPADLIPQLRSERDRLKGLLAEAKEARKSRQRKIDERLEELKKSIAGIEEEIKDLEDRLKA